jgi:predicted AlkP superfamily phosphohydrolase/phosphomutase
VEREEQEKIFSKRVKAGKRTYFFDVRATRSNDYYLTLTESRRYQKDGDFQYEKSKLFIYKEDFDKVLEALQETIEHIKTELMPEVDFEQFREQEDEFEPKRKKFRDDDFGGDGMKWE